MRRGLLGLLIALLLAAPFATSACAHAVLVSAEPADGAVLALPPAAMVLRFSEAVTVGAIRLIDAQGRTRDDAAVSAIGETITVTLPSDLPQGSQIVSYRVISADGHPVAGSVVVSIGAQSATVGPGEGDHLRAGLIWLARIGLYVGLFAGIGGAVFLRWIAPVAAAQRPLFAVLALGVAGAILSFGLQGLDLLGLPLRSLLALAPWRAAADTSLAQSLLVAIAAMAAGAAALRISSAAIGRGLALLALLGVGLALMLSGHAATAPPEAVSRAAIAIHGIGVAFWLGAFGPLAILVSCSPGTAAIAAMNRFSLAAVPVVGVLALSGLVLAAIELGTLGALIDSRYGLLLSIKLGLVAVLLTFAGLNRYRLVPALEAEPRAAPALTRSILWEAAFALAILAVVAGWRFTPPPRSLIPATPLALHIHTERAMVQVLVSPGRVGGNHVVLQLMNGDGSRLQAREATLTAALPAAGIEPIERAARLEPDGDWHIRNVMLPRAGRWQLRIDALVTDFDQISLQDEFELGPP